MKVLYTLVFILFVSKFYAQGEPFTKTVLNTGYNMEHPFDIFLDPFNADSVWVNERSGRVAKVRVAGASGIGGRRILLDIRSSVRFTRTGSPVSGIAQDGMFGMALDTTTNKFFVAYCYDNAGARNTRIVSYNVIRGGAGGGVNLSASATTLIQGLPGSNDHNGGRMALGPDSKIYYSCGDQGANQFANSCMSTKSQNDITAAELSAADYTNYPGHILRLNQDGTIPIDNPTFASVQSHVYSKGHRNPQGLTFQKDVNGNMFSGSRLYESEQGAVTDDEINIISSGANYGWPYVAGKKDGTFYKYKNWSADATVCPTPTTNPDKQECQGPQDATAVAETSSTYNSLTLTNPIVSQAIVASPDCANWLARPTVAWSSIEHYNFPNTGIPGWSTASSGSLILPTLKRSAIIRYRLAATSDTIVDIAGNAFDTIQYFRDNANLNRFRDITFNRLGTILYVITDSVGSTSGVSNADASITDRGKIVEYKFTGSTLALRNYSNVPKSLNDVVRVFPNPATDKIYINTQDLPYRDFTAKIYNSNGTLVMTRNFTRVLEKVDVRSLQSGFYIVQITNRNNVLIATKKFNIIR